ncbi:MAG TPA: alpha/beta hydrolase [Acidimicrobiales bacterium]|nr:alpha/beta hydrolase [Acidimicrobiales bacterium]
MDLGARHDGTGRRAAVAVMAAAMVASGCATAGRVSAPSATTRTPASTAPAATSVPTTITTAPVPPIVWSGCGDDLQCGSVRVPVDYSRPNGPTLAIAVERRPAAVPSERIGSLVINPGGPGTSGIDDLPNELSVLTPELLDRFDIVSFDPRGVERSDPVECAPGGASSASAPGPLPDPVPVTAAARSALLDGDEAYAQACEKYSGAILPFVGTVDAARDLDRIRAALGDATLTFMGHSYGTLLGAVYAQMYPGHVRAMVLDGAIDPALGTDQMVLDQAEGFESVLDDFFAWCAATPSCPWRPAGAPTAALLSLIGASRQTPLTAPDGRTAGPGEIYNALLDNLYSRSSWPSLGDALAQAAAGNGTDVITMSDSYSSGGSTNGGDANNAVNCLDHPVSRTPSTYPSLAAEAAAQAPVFGPPFAWGLLQCAVWPVRPTRTPAPVTDPGGPAILVVGTTGDPATPYQWAVALALQLRHGELVTWRGVNHVAYFYSPCVRAIDQAYLVSGTLPPPGTTCTD